MSWVEMKNKSTMQTGLIFLGSLVGSGLALCLGSNVQAAPLQGYVMQVQMTPAVCALDPARKKQRKCLEGYSLTITGLLPETSEKDCATRSSANLSPLQAKVVARVMPDENARVQLWRSIGGCIPMNASQYFRTIINLADRLKVPAELSSAETRSMSATRLKQQFLRLNSGLPAGALRFNCQSSGGNAVLTNIQVCYTVGGQYKQCSTQLTSSCPASFLIKGIY